MRIAYVSLIFGVAPGVFRKMDRMAMAARQEELNFDFYNLSISSDISRGDYKNLKFWDIRGGNAVIGRLKQARFINRLHGKYDAVVLRYPLYDPFIAAFLKHTERIVLEHHTKEIVQLKSVNDRRWITEKYLAPRWIRQFRGLVAATPEIVNYEVERSAFSAPTSFVPNSIFLPVINEERKICIDNGSDKIRLIMVAGEFAPWQGLEKVIDGWKKAGALTGQYELHLVGVLNSLQRILIQDMDGLVYHDMLTTKELAELYEKVDIGIGSFNIEDSGLNQATPLKVREYLGYGLPVVLGYDDPALPGDFPYALRLTEFDMSAIRSFVERVGGDRRYDVQQKAGTHIDSCRIVRRLYEFCAKCVSESTKHEVLSHSGSNRSAAIGSFCTRVER